MPKVHFVKKARKPNRLITQADIDRANAGEEGAASYYWWQFAYSPKSMSKTYPKSSQLTRSEYLGQAYEIEEEIGDYSCDTMEELQGFVEEKIGQILTLGEEQQEKLYNMPDQLQDSDSGQLLQSRADACESICSELESIDFDIEECEFDEDEWNRMKEEFEQESLSDESIQEKRDEWEEEQRQEWEQEKVNEKLYEIRNISFEWEY